MHETRDAGHMPRFTLKPAFFFFHSFFFFFRALFSDTFPQRRAFKINKWNKCTCLLKMLRRTPNGSFTCDPGIHRMYVQMGPIDKEARAPWWRGSVVNLRLAASRMQ